MFNFFPVQLMDLGIPGIPGLHVLMGLFLQLVLGTEPVIQHCTMETIPASHRQLQLKPSPAQVVFQWNQNAVQQQY